MRCSTVSVEHYGSEYATFFGHPRYAAIFPAMNGLILLAGERFRRRPSFAAGEVAGRQREDAELVAAGRHSARARHEKSPGLLRIAHDGEYLDVELGA